MCAGGTVRGGDLIVLCVLEGPRAMGRLGSVCVVNRRHGGQMRQVCLHLCV